MAIWTGCSTLQVSHQSIASSEAGGKECFSNNHMNKLIKVSDKSCLVKTDKIKAFNSIRTTRPTQKRNSFKNFGQLVLSVYANSVSKYVTWFGKHLKLFLSF